jgi:hypothetical protein
MLTWGHLIGFIIGAALGVLATDTTIVRVRKEATLAFSTARWRMFFIRPNPIWAVTRLLRFEAIILVTIVWLSLILLIWFCRVPHAERDFLIGSIIGVLAAPWVWLHFARSLRPDAGPSVKPPPETDDPATDESLESNSEDFYRYRFLTIVLGIAVLIAVLLPSIPTWLNRAQKVEALGLSITLTGPRNDQGNSVILPGTGTGTSTTADRLADATGLAYRISGGAKPLKEISADLHDFNDLSAIDRERAYIAFLTYSRLTDLDRPFKERQEIKRYREERAWWLGLPPQAVPHGGDSEGEQSEDDPGLQDKLDSYVQLAETAQKQHWPSSGSLRKIDSKFLTQLAPLGACLWEHAKFLKDYHLYTLDVGPFLRTLAIVLTSRSDRQTDDLTALQSTARTLSTQTITNRSADNAPDKLCDAQSAQSSIEKLSPSDLADLGSTPYPAMLLAYYMAAIDSVEGGVEILNHWSTIQAQKVKQISIRKSAGTRCERCWQLASCRTCSEVPFRHMKRNSGFSKS